MKTVCVIIPTNLPVPAIMGGAVESLTTLFLNENEIHKDMQIILITSWAPGIEKEAEKYEMCKFYYIKTPYIIKKVINAFNYFYGKITGEYDHLPSYFHHKTKKILNNIDADCVVVEHGIYKHFGYLNKMFDRNKLYLHIHGIGTLPDKMTQKIYGNIIGVSDYVVEMWKKDYSEQFNTNFFTCYNGINSDLFGKKLSEIERKKLRDEFGVKSTDLLVIYCGRIVEIKGVFELVSAVLKIEEGVKLMIVGSPNFKDKKASQYLKKIIRTCNNSDKVFFTGYVDNSLLFKYYQIADIQAIPSLCDEGAGLVGIEGMMSGLPLIITNSGGLVEYTNDKVAFILDKKDAMNNEQDKEKLITDLKNTISEVVNNKEKIKKMKEEALSLSMKFSNENYYHRLEEILGIIN